MKRMGLFFVLGLAAGCELAGHPAGTQLAQGRDIEAPHIVWMEQRPLVLFDRVAEDKTDLHALPFDGQGAETVWERTSAQTTWLSASGFLVNDWAQYLSVHSLASPTELRGLVGKVDGLRGDELLYHQGDGDKASFFLVHLPSGNIRELGRLTQWWLAPDGRLYYLSDTKILRSLGALDLAPEIADSVVSQFMISSDQRYAIARDQPVTPSTRPSETRDRLLALPSFRNLAVPPLANRECSDCAAWLGFSPDNRSFYYAENHRPDPTVVYQLDMEALEVPRATTRPGPSASALLWSPAGDLALLGERPCVAEGPGCQVVYRSLLHPGPSFEPLSSAVVGGRFFPSGRYLLYQDAWNGGRFRVARTDALSPEPSASAAVLSPKGSLLNGSLIDGATDTVVFWAQPMGGKSSIKLVSSADRSNLYAASAPDFTVRRLAEAVDTVAVGQGRVLALARFSPQDLTGDLLLFDLRTGREQTVASPVSAFWVSADCPSAGAPPLRARWQGTGTRATEIGQACPDQPSLLLTFVVRGRVKSANDGLWSLTLPPP